jgi:glycosyltransferase involved in cell wall biosynthesis
VKNIDIINIHDTGFEHFLRAFKKKKVYWQINDLPQVFVPRNKHSKFALLKRLIFKYNILIGIHFVTDFAVNVSKNREYIKKYFKRDAHVFYCGIDPIQVTKDINATLERFAGKKINLLTSGVFFQYRNYETQIEVVKKLLENGYDVHLNIIGSLAYSPDYVVKIKSMIENSGLNDRVIICGQVDESEFIVLHENADLFLFINIDQSWGLAVFEAMSCGLPVIVSESVGATEILKDKCNSIFVNPLDDNGITSAIIDITNNKEYFLNISENSKKITSEYTWESVYSSKMLNLMIAED